MWEGWPGYKEYCEQQKNQPWQFKKTIEAKSVPAGSVTWAKVDATPLKPNAKMKAEETKVNASADEVTDKCNRRIRDCQLKCPARHEMRASPA